ncbi:hypothetical protein ACFLZB_01125 [Nanoarchaeota archaeon]
MAKIPQIPKAKPKPAPASGEGHVFYPKLYILAAILAGAIGVVDIFNFYVVPEMVIKVGLVVTAVLLLMAALNIGVTERRKHVLKKFI